MPAQGNNKEKEEKPYSDPWSIVYMWTTHVRMIDKTMKKIEVEKLSQLCCSCGDWNQKLTWYHLC